MKRTNPPHREQRTKGSKLCLKRLNRLDVDTKIRKRPRSQAVAISEAFLFFLYDEGKETATKGTARRVDIYLTSGTLTPGRGQSFTVLTRECVWWTT